MAIERAKIEQAFEALWQRCDAGDWSAWVDLFAEDCSFVNALMKEPIRGRESLRAAAARWPNVVNRPEWVVIDGNRLAVGWNERQASMPEDAPPYRGFSTFLFDDEGLVRAYEGMFDTAAVVAALGGAPADATTARGGSDGRTDA